MPNNHGESIQVEYTPEFKRNLRALSKKYRRIRSDIQPIIERLQRHDIIGNQIPEMHHTIFKVRIRNSDIRKGKSSGYRLIYYIRTSTNIVLITVYSKLEQADVSTGQIRRIVSEYVRS